MCGSYPEKLQSFHIGKQSSASEPEEVRVSGILCGWARDIDIPEEGGDVTGLDTQLKATKLVGSPRAILFSTFAN